MPQVKWIYLWAALKEKQMTKVLYSLKNKKKLY